MKPFKELLGRLFAVDTKELIRRDSGAKPGFISSI
jgi:hypothetical protein